MIDTVVWFFAIGAPSLYPANGLLSMLTLDARSSYPWPLCWGNALWGYVAFKLYSESLPASQRPGFAYACIASFIGWTMPANIFVNLLILGRAPSALGSSHIVPVHLLVCAFLELFPGVRRALSGTLSLAFIDTFGVLDNITTALNYLETAHGETASPVASLLAAMTVNLGGGIARHHMVHGFSSGAAKFDEKFRTALLYSIATNGLYYYYTIASCAPQETRDRKGKLTLVEPDCPMADTLYMLLPLLAAVKNLMPLVLPATPKQKAS